VEAVIARAMQKNPRQRYQDAAEMAQDLERCRADLLRAGGAPGTGMDVDLFIGSGAHALPAQWSLVPAPGFDAAAPLKAMLALASQPPPAGHLRRLAWFAAYAAAAAAALAIALA
jgi:hypothetical protein